MQQWKWRLGAGERFPQGQQWHAVQPWKCTTQISCYGRHIPSCCPSRPTSTLIPSLCLPLPAPSHHGKGTKAGTLCEIQDSSEGNSVPRFSIGLKYYCSLRLFSPNLLLFFLLLKILQTLWYRSLLQSESSPCFSCCSDSKKSFAHLVPSWLPFFGRFKLIYVVFLCPINWALLSLQKQKRSYTGTDCLDQGDKKNQMCFYSLHKPGVRGFFSFPSGQP